MMLRTEAAIIADDLTDPKSGHAAIHQQLSDFLKLDPSFEVHHAHVAQANDLALVQSHWSIKWTDADGKPTESEVSMTVVARRQQAGHWLVVIDRPEQLGK